MIETWPDEKTTEVLLIEDPNRYSLFPIRHLEIYAFYKRHMASFWTVEEIDLTYDHCHWASLSLGKII